MVNTIGLTTKQAGYWKKNQAEWLAELSEYLSAFANFDGGYVIVGMSKLPDGSHVPDEGILLRHSKLGEMKEWLEDKLPAQVDPPLSRISVSTIPSPKNPERGVIAIYVPESGEAPHQGHNERFYVRTGSKNRALKTRQILDIQSRKKNPILRAEVEIYLRHSSGERQSRINVTVHNEGDILCRHFAVRAKIPIAFDGWFLKLGGNAFVDNEPKSSWILTLNPKGPIFPRSSPFMTVDFDAGPHVRLSKESSDIVQVRIFGDSAPFKDFSFPAKDVIHITDM